MTKEEMDFIGAMNMCDEISNEAYKKIVCKCEEQEPRDIAISRKAVLKQLKGCLTGGDTEYKYVKLHIDSIPPVSLARPTGHWINYQEEGYVECPFCHSLTNCEGNIEQLHFCFSCGAELGTKDMRGEQNE